MRDKFVHSGVLFDLPQRAEHFAHADLPSCPERKSWHRNWHRTTRNGQGKGVVLAVYRFGDIRGKQGKT